MLLNGVHLLPDLSGALVCPKLRLVAFADPLSEAAGRAAPILAAETVKRLASVLRQKRPARVVWLGDALPRLLASGTLARREQAELARMAAEHEWHWISEALPPGLPGHAAAQWAESGLVLRHHSAQGREPGEICAAPSPLAIWQGRAWPCFAIDGRRLVLPAFGPGSGGTNVLAPAFQPLFRRPFNVLMLTAGRITTRPRAALETAPA